MFSSYMELLRRVDALRLANVAARLALLVKRTAVVLQAIVAMVQSRHGILESQPSVHIESIVIGGLALVAVKLRVAYILQCHP